MQISNGMDGPINVPSCILLLPNSINVNIESFDIALAGLAVAQRFFRYIAAFDLNC